MAEVDPKGLVKTLVAVAAADGHIDEKESALLTRLAVQAGVSPEVLAEWTEAFCRPGAPPDVSIPADQEERASTLCAIVQMMLADGKISKSELDQCLLLGQRFGVAAPALRVIVRDEILRAARSQVQPEVAPAAPASPASGKGFALWCAWTLGMPAAMSVLPVLQEQVAYARAARAGSSAALVGYLDGYPEGRHRREARRFYAERSFEEARRTDTGEAYEAHVGRFGPSEDAHHEEAQGLALERRFEEAVKTRDPRKIGEFLVAHPDSKQAPRARQLLTELNSSESSEPARPGQAKAAQVPPWLASIPQGKVEPESKFDPYSVHEGDVAGLTRAAKRGSARAAYQLGVLHLRGVEFPCDHGEAERWLTAAARKGSLDAMLELVEQYTMQLAGGLEECGGRYSGGDSANFRWRREAARKGSREGLYLFGLAYENGIGVPKDAAEAVKWYVLAAQRGHPGAQKALAGLFQKGDAGVSPNPSVAYELYFLAGGAEEVKRLSGLHSFDESAEPDRFSPAWYRLGERFYLGKGVPRDLKEALKWYRKAAEAGHAEAQNDLGIMYHKGEGVGRSLAYARKWYAAAAAQGHDLAAENLAAVVRETGGAPGGESGPGAPAAEPPTSHAGANAMLLPIVLSSVFAIFVVLPVWIVPRFRSLAGERPSTIASGGSQGPPSAGDVAVPDKAESAFDWLLPGGVGPELGGGKRRTIDVSGTSVMIPRVCACCLVPTSDRMTVACQIVNYPVTRTFSWEFPVCPRCSGHSWDWRNWLLGVVLGGGFGLYLGQDSILVGLLVGIPLFCCVRMCWRGRLGLNCVSWNSPVTVEALSEGSFRFSFTNPTFADKMAEK